MKMRLPLLMPSCLGLVAAAVASISFTGCSSTSAEPVKLAHSEVFVPGEYDSQFYRIPALATDTAGNLIAVADKRIESNADLPGNIDVVFRKSTDGGNTWSEYVTVAEHNEDGGYGDPALVVDRNTGDIIVISTHGNGLWQDAPGHTAISRSRDGGVTWETPVDVSEMICVGENAPLKDVLGAFASSGAALQLKSGRIMFVLVVRQKDVENFSCYAIYSDDSGKTWNVSQNPGTFNGDESKVVELSDGTVLMSIRNRYRGQRMFSKSTDGGVTWSEPWLATDLEDPACNGDILLYTTKDGKDILLQSLPGSPNQRVDVSIYASMDNGQTWPNKYVVTELPSAYSAMTIMPNGNIGILTEEETNPEVKNRYHLVFDEVPLDSILAYPNPNYKK